MAQARDSSKKIPRILLVEDEADIADSIADGLKAEGFEVAWAPVGVTARRLLDQPWNLVILDLMLPDLPGEAILRLLAEKTDYPSVLVLTAKADVVDKLAMFRQGCDDYLTKPFLFEELLARVTALLRRPPRVHARNWKLNDLELFQESNTLKVGEESVGLTPKETALLRLFLENAGRVISRKEILESVWGLTQEPSANYVGIHLFKLRKKLAEVDHEDWLNTVKYSGYSFGPPGEASA